jgi:hypothetical protein
LFETALLSGRIGRLPATTPPQKRAPKARLEREIRRLQALERAHQQLREEHDLLKKTHPVHLRTKPDVFAFTDRHRETFAVTRL